MNRRHPLFLILCLLGCFLLQVSAKESDAEAAELVPERTVSLLDYYKDGGWMMHVLLLCSVGTIAVAVYCFTQINKKKMAPPTLAENMTKYMEKRDVTHAYELCQSNPSSYSEILSSALHFEQC